jgi:hypothetical protein
MKKSRSFKKGELEEQIDVLGQEDEAEAAKWVIKDLDAVELKKKNEYDDTLQFFDDKKKTFRSYYEALANQVHILLENFVDWHDLPYLRSVAHSMRGVGVVVQDPEGKTFARGFKPMGEPKYDLHAIKVLIWQTENVVEEYVSKHPQGEVDRQDNGGSETPLKN